MKTITENQYVGEVFYIAYGFVYVWTQKSTGRFYVGSSTKNPDKYMCSSADSEFRGLLEQAPYDFEREIIAEYRNCPEDDLRDHERRLLKAAKAQCWSHCFNSAPFVTNNAESVFKSVSTRTTPDENGSTIAKRAAIKAAATMAVPDENGETIAQRYGKKVSKTITTPDENGETIAQRTGKRILGPGNPMFEGYFHTPYGKFSSASQAVKVASIPITGRTLARWCKNPDEVFTSTTVLRTAFLSEADIGKTRRELGFWFEKDNCEALAYVTVP